MTIEDLIDQNRRVNYNGLTAFINQVHAETFAEDVRRPFLVGQELYNGLLAREHVNNIKTMPISRQNVRRLSDNTKFFVKAPTGESHREESITRAIFYLVKKPFPKDPPNMITVGRHSDNDIVIADYSISRRHAVIEVYFDKFFLSDANSTNKSSVDGHTLRADEKRQIATGSILAFGRIVFMLMSGMQVYEMLRTEEEG